MTKFSRRALYRWKTFWLGIVIIVFLTWAWARGRNYRDYLGYVPGSSPSHIIASSGGYLSYATYSFATRFPAMPLAQSFVYESSYEGLDDPWFPNAFASQYEERSGTRKSVHAIANWTLLVLFLLPWTAFLAWRWRRTRRAAVPPLH